jgi:hypothetical protein
VAVWSSQVQDGSGFGVYAQRFSASGVAQGDEFLVNTTTLGDQQFASVAMSANGDFVVVWSDDSSGDSNVMAQRYDADGVAQGSEFQVNDTVAGDQRYSSVAMDDNGNFFVTWSSFDQDGDGWGVYGKRFDAAGVALGPEFRVNATTVGDQLYSQAAMDADGDAVVVWESVGQDGSGSGVYAQRYNSAGTAQGAEFRVNTRTSNDQRWASVDMAAAGSFVVTWTSSFQDGSGDGVYAQRYAASGATQGTEFRVSSSIAGDQQHSRVSVAPAGDFLISWSSVDQDGDGSGIYARKYTWGGVVEEADFRVNTTTAGDQLHSAVTLTSTNNAVFLWSGNGSGDDSGVFAQRFTMNDAPVAVTTGGAVSYTENGVPLVIDPSLTLSDNDSLNLAGATVRISGNYINGQDTLLFSDQNGITGSWDAATGTMTLSGSASVVNYRTALRSIAYLNNSDDPSTAVRTVSFTVSDGFLTGNTTSRNINITALNDAPVLGNIEAGPLAYDENGSAAITSTITLTDLDHALLTGASVQITGNYVNGEDLLTFTSTATITGSWDAATGTLTLGGVDTVANYQAALRNVRYVNTSDTPNSSTRTASFRVSDGIVNSNTVSRDITVAAINDAPVNVLPPTQNTSEDTPLVFSGAAGNRISVSDVDAQGGPLQVTLNATHGAVTLSGAAGLTFTTGDGDNDSTMTFSGLVDDINAALDGLTFLPTANFAGAAQLQIVTDDLGNSGAGGAQVSTDAVSILVDGVNDGPVITAPAAQTVGEESQLVFSSAGGNQVSISDSDANGSPVQVTLTATNGTLTLAGTSGLTFSAGDGFGDPTLTFTGTVASINAALDGLQFQPSANFTGAASLQIDVDDQGSTGAGGPLTATDTVAITVGSVNDAPVNIVPPAQSTVEGTALVFSSAGGNQISIIDSDAGANAVSVTLAAANGTVSLAGTGGLSFTAGDGADDATMTFTGTIADINAALDGLSFAPAAGFSGAASLQIVTDDLGHSGSGGGQTDSDTVNITVGAINDAPVNSVPSAQSVNEDGTLVFSSGAGNQISISDSDAGAGAVRVTLSATHGAITLAGTSGLSFTAGDGSGDATMTFTGTIANINAALNGMSYAPTAGFSGAASLQIVTDDLGNTGSGGGQTDSDTVSITVNAVNDAPVNSVPSAQSVNEDATLVFSSAAGNQISISDSDAGGSSVRVTLSATNGTLNLAGTSGLSFVAGDGSGDATMTFTGTIANINAALNGMSYTPTAGFSGAAALQITTNDLGSSGSGGPLTDSDTVNITVGAVNDAPVNSVPPAQTVDEDATLVFSTAGGNRISISDSDAGGSSVRVTLSATSGTLNLAGTSGLSFTAGDGSGDATMTFTGTIANINAALDGLSFLPTANFSGAASLQITTSDLGNTGSGGPLTAVNTVNITVNPVADDNVAPVVKMTGTRVRLDENKPTAVDARIKVSDLNNANLVSATVAISSGYAAGQDVLNFESQNGITGSWDASTGVLTLSGSATVQQYQAALRSVTYLNTSENPNTELRTFSVRVSDGADWSAVVSRNGKVVGHNDKPTIAAPSAQTIHGQSLVFSAANGNAIKLGDVDAGGAMLKLTLTATKGRVTLGCTRGIEFVYGDGVSDSHLVIRGTLADLNRALDGLLFQVTRKGATGLHVRLGDLGNTGAGGAQRALHHVDIIQAPQAPAFA